MSLAIAKSKLPMEFIQELYMDFNERNADKILLGMLDERNTTLRVNTLKTNNKAIKQVLKELNIEYEQVYFYEDAFIIKNKKEKDLQNLEIYKNGSIYIQSLSSMLPPLILNPQPGDNVLDLTASPGSKTTQMSALMQNKGYILANEIDKIRCDKLRYNIKMQGAQNVEIINEDGRKISKDVKEKFDKVLLDVPCSGEGRFLINKPKTYLNWSKKQVLELSNMQKELFESGYNALKRGGTLVYSTCTLNKIENENIIDWAIKKLGAEILNINIKLNELTKVSTKGLDKDVEKAIKILPSKNMEGFFVCLLKKPK